MGPAQESPLERGRALRRLFAAAVALLALFYATALGALVGMAWLARWLLAHGEGVHGALGAGLCAVGAAHLGYWAWPRRYRGALRGVEITPRAQPALFEELRAVARAVGAPAPTRVALDDDANASVLELEDAPGLGPERALQLGLPLLRALTVGELRALVAHELGHFVAEHRHGPWMRRAYLATRITSARLQALAARARILALPLAMVSAPFWALAQLFQRVALAASRRQERYADELARRAAGAAATLGMLRRIHVAEIALRAYREHHVVPALERGLLPPLGEGFSRLLASEAAVELGERWLRRCEARGATASDSHPPLAERLAAAARAPTTAPTLRDSDRPAILLLDDPEQYETEPLWPAVRARGGRRASWREVEDGAGPPPTTAGLGATSPEAPRPRPPQLSEGA